MTKQQFDEIKERLHEFCFTSLKYTDYEEIADYEVLINNNKVIIIYGFNSESDIYEYHWACNYKEDLLPLLDKRNRNEKITFVPKSWVSSIEGIGFNIYAIWNDYFADDLEKFANTEETKYVGYSNAHEASKVTRSCIGQSRGFTGQSEEWMQHWIENKEPATPSYTYNCAVIAEIMQDMVGVICVGTYESGDKTILWIREIAVKPEFQRKGIARKLIGQALAYGLKHGTKKAFLMADECNDNAIHLYKSMGFKAGTDEGQIDMIRDSNI
jgi:ribosomal protein S18 acetylase RimI-like enzyme